MCMMLYIQAPTERLRRVVVGNEMKRTVLVKFNVINLFSLSLSRTNKLDCLSLANIFKFKAIFESKIEPKSKLPCSA